MAFVIIKTDTGAFAAERDGSWHKKTGKRKPRGYKNDLEFTKEKDKAIRFEKFGDALLRRSNFLYGTNEGHYYVHILQIVKLKEQNENNN